MGNCAGIDWASVHDDVLMEDSAGAELLAATFARDEDGVGALCAALECFEVELVAIERPEGLLVDRLLDAGVRVWRCTPTRSRRRAAGSAPRAASPIGLTGSCCASWRALVGTASGSWSPTMIRPRRWGPWSVRARIWSKRGWRCAVSCGPSCSCSGPARSDCSPIWTARSRWRSWLAAPARPMRAGSGRSVWRRS
jgi:hypothetical protein